jgi:hypothetical protein
VQNVYEDNHPNTIRAVLRRHRLEVLVKLPYPLKRHCLTKALRLLEAPA